MHERCHSTQIFPSYWDSKRRAPPQHTTQHTSTHGQNTDRSKHGAGKRGTPEGKSSAASIQTFLSNILTNDII